MGLDGQWSSFRAWRVEPLQRSSKASLVYRDHRVADAIRDNFAMWRLINCPWRRYFGAQAWLAGINAGQVCSAFTACDRRLVDVVAAGHWNSRALHEAAPNDAGNGVHLSALMDERAANNADHMLQLIKGGKTVENFPVSCHAPENVSVLLPGCVLGKIGLIDGMLRGLKIGRKQPAVSHQPSRSIKSIFSIA